MRRTAGLIWLFLFFLPAAAAADPAYLEITAPGGIKHLADGSSEARGTSGRPVVAVTDEYEITAQSLLYDWKGAGTAAGNVRWRSRRADRPFELRADRISFSLTAGNLRAEGRIVLDDGDLVLQADALAADLTAGLYTVSGDPARAGYESHQIQARNLVYSRGGRTLKAAGAADWLMRINGEECRMTADNLIYDFSAKRGTAAGGVRFEAGDTPVCLLADSLAADLGAGLYTASGSPAQARHESHQIQAERLVYSHAGARTLEASGDLVWQLQLAGGEDCRIAAGELTYDLASGRGAATGNVNIESGAVRIAGEKLGYENDLLAVSGGSTMARGEFRLKAPCLAWQPDAEVFTAAGRVEFSDPAFTGNCDELRYAAAENRVFLTGAVRLARGRDIITGHEAICDLDAGRALVTGAAKAVLEG